MLPSELRFVIRYVNYSKNCLKQELGPSDSFAEELNEYISPIYNEEIKKNISESLKLFIDNFFNVEIGKTHLRKLYSLCTTKSIISNDKDISDVRNKHELIKLLYHGMR